MTVNIGGLAATSCVGIAAFALARNYALSRDDLGVKVGQPLKDATISIGEIIGWMSATLGLAFCAMSFVDPAFDFVNSILVNGYEPADNTSRLYCLVMGAVFAGYGTTIATVAKVIDQGRTPIAKSLLAGVLTWFVIDTTGSLAHGSWQNAIFNVLGLCLLAPATWSLQ